jgi:predicted transcriptional regulator
MQSLSGRRTAITIIFEILTLLSNEPALKTKIMYSVKMSYKQTKTYLNKLLTQGYIENKGNGGRTGYFWITDRGIDLLPKLSKTQNIVSETQIHSFFENTDIIKAKVQPKTIFKRVFRLT